MNKYYSKYKPPKDQRKKYSRIKKLFKSFSIPYVAIESEFIADDLESSSDSSSSSGKSDNDSSSSDSDSDSDKHSKSSKV